MKRILVATNAQKILDFLVRDPGTQYLSREIQHAAKTSKAGTNLALRELSRAGIVEKEKRGKVCFYSSAFNDPVVKQLKVLRTVMSVSRLTEKLAKESTKIVLYGSSSRGENTRESDLDIFVVSASPERARAAAEGDPLAKTLQLTIRTPLEYSEMEKREPTFFREVERGIVLWESTDEG